MHRFKVIVSLLVPTLLQTLAVPLARAETPVPSARSMDVFAKLAPEGRWLVDPSSGTAYRQASARERQRNGWPRGTFLARTPGLRSVIEDRSASVMFRIPYVFDPGSSSALSLQAMSLGREGTLSDVEVIERAPALLGVSSRRFVPKVTGYWSVGTSTSGVSASLLVGEHAVLLKANLFGQRVDGRWLASSAWIEPLPGDPGDRNNTLVFFQDAHGGTAAIDRCQGFGGCEWFCSQLGGYDQPDGSCAHNPHIVPPSHQCIDGIDNDDEDGADGADGDCDHHGGEWGCDDYAPGHVHKSEYTADGVLMGEGQWCTKASDEFAGEWWLPAFAHGNYMRSFVESVGINPDLLLTEAQVVAVGCWVFPSYAEARACTMAGACPAGYGDYPWVGAANWAPNYTDGAWDDVRLAVSYDGLSRPLQWVQVMYFNNFDATDDSEVLRRMRSDGTIADLCGTSPVPKVWPPMTVDLAPTSIADLRSALVPAGALCTPVASVHELSHMLKSGHEEEGSFSYMAEDGNGTEPFVGAGNENLMEECLLDWECPRRSGF